MTNWPYFDRHFWIIFVKFRAQGGYSLYLDIEFIEKNARNPHLYLKCISYILLGFAYRWQKTLSVNILISDYWKWFLSPLGLSVLQNNTTFRFSSLLSKVCDAQTTFFRYMYRLVSYQQKCHFLCSRFISACRSVLYSYACAVLSYFVKTQFAILTNGPMKCLFYRCAVHNITVL